MKKIIFNVIVLFAVVLGFTACENPDSFSSNSLVGIWVVDVKDGDQVSSYTEFGKNGVFTVYEQKGFYVANYVDGCIEYKEGTEWKEVYVAKYTFNKATQTLLINDENAGIIEKISADEFRFTNSITNDDIKEGIYRRVKEFKQVESTIDDTTNKCWKIVYTYAGISAASYVWCTELECVWTLQESQKLVSVGKYTYEAAPATDEEACYKLSN